MSTADWKWVSEKTALAIHDEQLAEHGGMPGVREMSLVQSALHRPQNSAAYGAPDIADLAAAYAYGISRNLGFLDGNKRTAFVVAYVFLLDQGYELIASDQEAVTTMLAVAAGEISEVELAVWFRGYIRPI
ncbi:MAG: type II toxin-antitoxin system death-on-curing family toxin [Terracidiphilus sp.]